MSGVGPTEWTVTARPRSAASTATAVAPETSVDRFAMTPPGAGSRGGTASCSGRATCQAPPGRDARDAERRRGWMPVPAVVIEHAYDAAALVELEAGDRPLAGAEH